MLKKIYRLSSNFEFFLLKRHGVSFKSDSFLMLYLIPKFELKNNKLSVVVSKKVSKKAVVRNAIKRKFYNSIKGSIANITPKQLIVIYPNTKCLSKTYEEINSEFNTVLQKVFIF